MKKFIITKKDEGRSLGNFLKKELNLPTSYIHKLVRKGKIKLDKLKPDLNWKLKENLELIIFADFQDSKDSKLVIPVQLYKKNLDIAYEDENILALNKKAGIAVQPTKFIPFEKTIVGVAEYYAKQHNFTPYLLHRLDKDTSGVILLGKNPKTRKFFYNLFQKRLIHKTYLALIKGTLKAKRPINKEIPDNKGNFVTAITKYKIIKAYKDCTLLEVYPETGRFHQIRQHMKIIGHPIVCDELYGDFRFNKMFAKIFGLRRQFLHAKSIEFNFENKDFLIESPLPPELQKILKRL